MAGTPKPGGQDLRLEDVTKRFGTFVAVDNLSLTIPSGSFFALLGPSGCGKTTTLRMVAGLEEPTEGVLWIGDEDVTHTKPYKRPVNTVFQNYALFPHLDIFENIAFGLRRRGSKSVKGEVEAALELVELSGMARRKPAQLSGGQQQRVALARAIVNRPAVLLLDEPLGALDLKLRRQMQIELKRIQTEVGLTFIHVTHDQEEAMTMADTIAVMNAGRIEQLGPPAELYDAPATVFVANFLGQSNLVRGTVASDDGDVVTVTTRAGHVVVPAARATARTGDVVMGVRPEKVRLEQASDTPNLNGDNMVGPGTVVDVSFSGVSTQYIVDVPCRGAWTVCAQHLGVDAVARRGDSALLMWNPHHAFTLPGDEDLTAGVDPDVVEVLT